MNFRSVFVFILLFFCLLGGVRAVNIGIISNEYHATVIQRASDYITEIGLLQYSDFNITEAILDAESISTVKQQVCHELTQSSDVLIAITECSKLNILEKESSELRIPLVSIHVDFCYDVLPVSSLPDLAHPASSFPDLAHPASSFLDSALRIQPRLKDVVDVLISLTDHGDFSKVAVIFDMSVFAGINEFRHELSSRFIETSITQLANKNPRDMLSWLHKLRKLENQTVCTVILLDTTMTLELLKMWSSFKAKSTKISWIVVFDMVVPDMFSILDESGSLKQMIFVTPLVVSEVPNKLGLNSTNNKWLDNLTISEAYLFDSIIFMAELYKSVLHSNTSLGTKNVISCNGKNIEVSALHQHLVKVIDKVSTNKTMVSPIAFGSHGYNTEVTYGIYNVMFRNESLTFDPVGSWKVDDGLALMKNVFSKRDQGLLNMTFRIGINEAAPFTVFADGEWYGMCIDILNELAARLGFRYELVVPADKLWGASTANGSWNGIVGMTVRGDCDFGVGPFSLSAERESVIDFTKPFMEDGSGLIMRRFEDKNSKMFRTFKPFSRDVWILISGSIITVGLTLCIVNRFSPMSGRGDSENMSNRTPKGLADNLWIVYGSYMEQGAEKMPANISGRLILGFWWVFTILMVASYTANLAAFLTVSFSDEPIRSLEDLAKQSSIRPLVKSGSNLETLFKKGETKTHRRIWEMLQSSPRVTNNSAALDLVLTGQYAYMSDSMQLKLMKTLDCDNLMISDSTFNVVGLAFVVSESSPLLEVLSVNIIKLLESGLIEKWKQKWFSSTDKICTNNFVKNTVKSLELESTVGPFLVFSVSTGFALFCLALEHVVFQLTKWRYGKNRGNSVMYKQN